MVFSLLVPSHRPGVSCHSQGSCRNTSTKELDLCSKGGPDQADKRSWPWGLRLTRKPRKPPRRPLSRTVGV